MKLHKFHCLLEMIFEINLQYIKNKKLIKINFVSGKKKQFVSHLVKLQLK